MDRDNNLEEMKSLIEERKPISGHDRGKLIKMAIEKDLLNHIIQKYGSIIEFEITIDRLFKLQNE